MRFFSLALLLTSSLLASALPSPTRVVHRRPIHRRPIPTPTVWQPAFPGDIPPDYDTAVDYVKAGDGDFESKWEELRKWYTYFTPPGFGSKSDDTNEEPEAVATYSDEEIAFFNYDKSELGFHMPPDKRNLPEENEPSYPELPQQETVNGLWSPPVPSPSRHWLHETSWSAEKTPKQPERQNGN